jgi:hypothetical protein
MMKKCGQVPRLSGGIAFLIPVWGTGLAGFHVPSFLEIAVGKIGEKRPARALPEEEKRKKRQAARTTRVRLAQLRYVLLVLALGGVIGLLTVFLLKVLTVETPNNGLGAADVSRVGGLQ